MFVVWGTVLCKRMSCYGASRRMFVWPKSTSACHRPYKCPASPALPCHPAICCPVYRRYIACLGLLLPAWAYTGLDSAEYMAEETVSAARMQPRAILMGCVSMFVLGLGLCISLLFGMPVGADRHAYTYTHAHTRTLARAQHTLMHTCCDYRT